MKKPLRYALAVFFPERCAYCGKVIPPCREGCASCVQQLPHILPPICVYCGRSDSECTCHQHRMHFERCVTPFTYSGVAKKGILRLKEQGKDYVADTFADEMVKIIRREYGELSFDYCIPVPVSKNTLKQRGYNQSLLLAKEIAARLSIPLRETLIKIYETTPQKELSALARSGNVLGVFDVDGKTDLTDTAVLLVDDILTTGATLDECAKTLKIYGAKTVYAVTATSSGLVKASCKK